MSDTKSVRADFSDGKILRFRNVATFSYIDKPVPGWQMAHQDGSVSLLVAHGVELLTIEPETSNDSTPGETR